MNNPRLIQFTNGNMVEYIYTASGEKLRTIHRTAVSNLGLPIGGGIQLTPALTLYVDSTDYVGNFIFRNGKADKFLFNGGYCSFTSYNQPVYHYYTQDHLGNNRAVVNEDGTLEQVTHYYPFGDVYGDAGLNASAQPYKYNGKELDRMYRLDLYDYGARSYDAVMPMWTSVDPMCEKYYNVSPYVYCKENPVKSIDVNGDSCLILLAPYGAKGAGHMAIAIQNESEKWCLYSKNGTEEHLGILGKEGSAGSDKRNDRGTPRDMEDSPQDLFQDKSINPTDNGKNPNVPDNAPEYTEGYLLPTTPEQDKKMEEGALEIINKDYNVFSSNCAQTVQNALRKAELNPGKGLLPKQQVYPSILKNNPGGTILLYYNIKTNKYYK